MPGFNELTIGYRNQPNGFPQLTPQGVVAIAQGGTNAKTAVLALVALGIDATAAEINTACDGILATALEINTICDGVLTNLIYFNPASIAAGAYLATDFSITGAALGDQVLIGAAVDVVDLIVSATVTATNMITLVLYNPTSGAIDLASSTWKFKVIK